MAKVLKSVTDTLVVGRVEECNGATPPGMHSLSNAVLWASLEMMRNAGVVPAVEVNGEEHEQAVAEVLAVFSSGYQHAPSRMAALKDSWPALHEALGNLYAVRDDAKA